MKDETMRTIILETRNTANSIEISIAKRKKEKNLFKIVKKNNKLPKRDKFSIINNSIERFKAGELSGAALRKVIFTNMIMNYHDGYMKCYRDYDKDNKFNDVFHAKSEGVKK